MSETSQKPRRPALPPDLAAMAAIDRAMEGLLTPDRWRVVAWFRDKFDTQADTEFGIPSGEGKT